MREISHRFKAFRKALKLTQQQMAELLGVKKDNVGSWDTRTNPPYDVIIFLMKEYHLNPYWLLLGEGEMYDLGSLQKNGGSVNYGKDSTVVTTGVNNGHIVAEGGSNTYHYQGGRGLRLCEFVRWWMESHDAEDQVWLEKQLERAVPEYLDWKKEQ